MSLNLHRRKNRGFTLPEVLLIVIILGIFAALAAPSFLNWVNKKRVEDTLLQVEGAVKEAQAAAIRKSQTCELNISASSVTSIPPNCLPTGTRDLTQISGGSNATGVSIIAKDTEKITFSPKGTTTSSNIFVFYHPDQAQGMRCLAISSGIGIIRTGQFKGPHIPSTDDATSTNCQTS
ncbi:pilus assembly FimT family protein [Acaryochloris marina NIES-2412]|uniref:pilus assembly FimT family protein n=1 Tax=Acaryochloris marina TaxID=155978 RepID=UPI004057F912